MDPASQRTWLVFLHVVSVLGFNAYLNTMYFFLVGIFVTGIGAGLVGGWWTSGRLWIW